MSIHSGTLSIFEVERIYHVGFSFAKNIIDNLEQNGYIKKHNETEYFLIRTEQEIDRYVKEHMQEFRPEYYDYLEMKDNGEYTLKRKAKNTIKATPMFLCRLFFAVPAFVLFLLVLFIGTKANKPFLDIVIIEITLYFFVGIPANLIYGFYMSNKKQIKFREFMLRPWLKYRVKTVLEIRKILKASNIKFKVYTYDKTISGLKLHLKAKRDLAQHYGDMANNAENENEFRQSMNSCLQTLEWMSQFEKFGVYTYGSYPSDDIKTIKDGMEISIQRFNNRMAAAGNVDMDLDHMDGHDFEYACAGLLKKNGFNNVEVTKASGDHGIDVLAEKNGITYAIQCKRYTDNVTVDAIREANAGKSLYHRDIAVVMTNRYFTKPAVEEALSLGVKMWDRAVLQGMIECAGE